MGRAFSFVSDTIAEEPAPAWRFKMDAMFGIIVPRGPAFLPPTHRLGEYRTNKRRTARRILYRSRYYQNLSLREKVKLMRKMMDIPLPGH